MQAQIDQIRKVRAFLLESIKDLTIDELNEIPAGFNNNIVWNLGHMVAAQQLICYVRAGLPPKVDAAFIDRYRMGTKPEARADEAAVAEIKALLFSTVDLYEQDLADGLWQQYPSWTPRYGVLVDSIAAATNLLLFHEGLHIGAINALKRLVKPAVVAG